VQLHGLDPHSASRPCRPLLTRPALGEPGLGRTFRLRLLLKQHFPFSKSTPFPLTNCSAARSGGGGGAGGGEQEGGMILLDDGTRLVSAVENTPQLLAPSGFRFILAGRARTRRA
jgi:hypothetical protein